MAASNRRFGGLGLRERAARNGASRSWGVPKSPRVLPRQGIDDESVLKAMVVASVIGTVIAMAFSLLLYGLYQLWRRARRS